MSSEKEALINSLQNVLAMHGVQSARVVVEMLPEHQCSSDSTPKSAGLLDIVVSSAETNEGQLKRPSDPVEKRLMMSIDDDLLPQATKSHDTAVKESLLSAVTSLTQGSSNENMDASGHMTMSRQGSEEEMTHNEMNSTVSPADAMTRIPAVAPAELVEEDDTEAKKEILLQFVGKSVLLEDKRAREKARASSSPRLSLNTATNRACISSGWRDSMSATKASTPAASAGSHSTSDVMVEDQKVAVAPVKMAPLSSSPVFSIPSNESSGFGGHPSSGNNSRAPGNMSYVSSPEVQHPQQHVPLHEVGEDPQRQSILLSSSLPQMRHMDGSSRGTTQVSAIKKLPPVVKNRTVSSSGTCDDADVVRGNSEILQAPSLEAKAMNSKQRLQEMLQEQRIMEQQSMAGRARHEELIREAEKYLQDLRKARTGEDENADSAQLPVISSHKVSLSSHHSVPTSSSPIAANCTNPIKVVKFTMPEGEKAKDEVVAQLSTSHGGLQHLSSKDRISMMLREQQKMLSEKKAGEQEYQKLLLQAIAYHDGKKKLKEVRQQEFKRAEHSKNHSD